MIIDKYPRVLLNSYGCEKSYIQDEFALF